MAVTLTDRATIAADLTFQGQVRMAALAFAVNAIRAAKTPNNRADEKSYALAATILLDGAESNVKRFAYDLAAATQFNFTAGAPPVATDAAITAAIPQVWQFWAGITTTDLS